MDYGPFGFIEKFEPLWNMWVGGGEHFGFLNQPAAGALWGKVPRREAR